MRNTVDSKINGLKPGQSVVVSQNGGITVTVERTGDGKRVKFVRHTASGFVVFKTGRF